MDTVKKIWNIVTTVLVIVVVLCAVFLMGTRLMGYKVFNVVSGSMSPTYNVGDLIYVKEIAPEAVKVGDPITFVLNEDLVVATHRVIDINYEDQHFHTKGDANETADAAPVHFKNLIGVPKFSIPKLGYVSDYIQNPPGTYVTVGIVVLLVIAVFLPDLFAKKKEKPAETTAEAPVTPEPEKAEGETEPTPDEKSDN